MAENGREFKMKNEIGMEVQPGAPPRTIFQDLIYILFSDHMIHQIPVCSNVSVRILCVSISGANSHNLLLKCAPAVRRPAEKTFTRKGV